MAAAATLRQIGADVRVYEQAPRFARIGAGIQMMPNSMKVLRRIGVEKRVIDTSFKPYSHLNREWNTGKVMRELPMPESLFGAPYLCMHRADLHEALAAVVPEEIIHLDKKLTGLDQSAEQVTLAFADGTRAQADAVIGADGVHSVARDFSVLSARRHGYWFIQDQVVGSRPSYRHLLHQRGSQRALLCDQRAGTGRVGDARILVGKRRCEGIAQGVRRFPSRRSRRARSVPGLPQVGDP